MRGKKAKALRRAIKVMMTSAHGKPYWFQGYEDGEGVGRCLFREKRKNSTVEAVMAPNQQVLKRSGRRAYQIVKNKVKERPTSTHVVREHS